MSENETSKSILAVFLSRKRAESGLTQEELSNRSGASIKTIQRVESGEQTPSKRILTKIFNALSIFGIERHKFGLEEPSYLKLVSNGSDVFEYLGSGDISDQDFFYDINIDTSKTRESIYSFLTLLGKLRAELLEQPNINKFSWFEELDISLLKINECNISVFASTGDIPPDIELEQSNFAYANFIDTIEPGVDNLETPNILYAHYSPVKWIPLQYGFRNDGYNIWKKSWDPIFFGAFEDIENLALTIDRITLNETKVASFMRSDDSPFKIQRYGSAYSLIGNYRDGYQCSIEELYALQVDVLKTIKILEEKGD